MIAPVKQPVVMTIAGFDPSGGAGVLADIKTISAFGCHGVAAVTSLTFQNTQKVFGASHQTVETLRRQVEPLFNDFEIAAIKTGMLGTAEIANEITNLIKLKDKPLVVDPVLRSTSGFDLTDRQAIEALKSRVIPLASVVTPNAEEAQRLTGVVIRDRSSMQRAAQAILEMGARAVLITSGDLDLDSSSDVLLDDEGAVTYDAVRIRSRHTHGTGCALASALACLLARGLSLRESIPIAKEYVSQAIQSAPQLGHGHGPLNHFPPSYPRQS